MDQELLPAPGKLSLSPAAGGGTPKQRGRKTEDVQCLLHVSPRVYLAPGMLQEPQDQSKGTEAAVCVPSRVTQRRGWESSSIAGPAVTHPASSDAKPSSAQPLLIRRELQTHVLSPNATTTWVVALLGPSRPPPATGASKAAFPPQKTGIGGWNPQLIPAEKSSPKRITKQFGLGPSQPIACNPPAACGDMGDIRSPALSVSRWKGPWGSWSLTLQRMQSVVGMPRWASAQSLLFHRFSHLFLLQRAKKRRKWATRTQHLVLLSRPHSNPLDRLNSCSVPRAGKNRTTRCFAPFPIQ